MWFHIPPGPIRTATRLPPHTDTRASTTSIRKRDRELKRSGRGLVRRYVAKMTGLSRAQATRLLGMYMRGEKVQPKPYRRRRFAERYTHADAELLATVD